MGRSKIVDEAEALKMLQDGAKYEEMVAFYREKYGVETTKSLWSRFFNARRNGPSRTQRHDDIVPWITPGGSGNERLVNALRAHGRLANGVTLSRSDEINERSVRMDLILKGMVIDYDFERGAFVFVPYRPGIDTGWVRNPFLDDNGEPVAPSQLQGKIRLGAVEHWLATGEIGGKLDRSLRPGPPRKR